MCFKIIKQRSLNTKERAEYEKCCNAAIGRESWLDRSMQTFIAAGQWDIEVTYEVAFQEADPQMVNLVKLGYFHAIVCEDQDILVLGARKVIMKLNYGKWKYGKSECDFVDSSAWSDNVPMPKCDTACDKKRCSECGPAVGTFHFVHHVTLSHIIIY